MTENTSFNDEWNKLQKAFVDNVGSNFVNSSDTSANENNVFNLQQSPLFNQWLSDVDKCWDDYADIESTEIDSLYKKVSSSSRFFMTLTETVRSMKHGEKTDDFIGKTLNGFVPETSDTTRSGDNFCGKANKNSADSNDSNSDNILDFNTFWGQVPDFIANQQQTLSKLSNFFEDAAKNPDFSAALAAYLIALQKYQLIFFNVFKTSAIQVVETLKLNNDKPRSPAEIISVSLEVLEENYVILISKDSYSKAYADVINSWMLMLSKSNKPLSEFSSTSMFFSQLNPNDK